MQAVDADQKDMFDLMVRLAKGVICVSWQSNDHAKADARTQEYS
jgi:hypothetical protein